MTRNSIEFALHDKHVSLCKWMLSLDIFPLNPSADDFEDTQSEWLWKKSKFILNFTRASTYHKNFAGAFNNFVHGEVKANFSPPFLAVI